MGLFYKLLVRFQDNWCKDCKCEMEKVRKQLFALPDMTASRDVDHKHPGYYKRELRIVDKKADIPPGMYACGAIQYRCPECGRRLTKLDLFLPVRDEEKHETPVLFEHGELDEFLWH